MSPALGGRTEGVDDEVATGGATDLIAAGLRIDRTSPVPLWFQVAQGLQELIGAGQVPPGSRLDNEVALGEQLKLSRPTLRKAMEHLVDQGLIVRRRGVGTTVVQPKVQRPLALSSLYDDLSDSGQEPTTTVVTNEVIAADASVAAALEVAEGDEVVHLVRLRTAAGRRIARMTNYLPCGPVRVTTAALEAGGLYELLRSQGITLHSAIQRIGARRAETSEARLLDEPRGAALLTMERTAYDDLGRPIEHGRHIYAASRYDVKVHLLASQ